VGGSFDLLITNGNYGGVNAIEIIANPANTTCTLAASTNSTVFGSSVNLTVAVQPVPPNGETVTFIDGSTTLGTGMLAGGNATFQASGLGTGTHPLKAVYGGDGNYLASTSALFTVTVTPTLSAPVVWPATVVYVGDNVAIVCSNYAGTPPFVFQWQVSGDGSTFTDLPGTTANLLSLAQAHPNNSGYYRLWFSANSQAVTSTVAQLTVKALPVLGMQWNSSNMILSWPEGRLLQATNVQGPWTTNDVGSPYTNQPAYQQMFYRLRVR
jgi:hypothetical protein